MAAENKDLAQYEPAFQIMGVSFIVGAGTPNGTVTAPQGSFYLNTTGSSSSTRAYINSDGGTTWVAVTTAS